jgi:hypothetical protein
LNIVSDLDRARPGRGVEISELHLVLDVKSMTISAAARHFGVPSPRIRLLLERFPIATSAGRPSTQLQRLRARITSQDLTHLHHRDAHCRLLLPWWRVVS